MGSSCIVKNLDGQVIGPSEAVSDNSSPDFIEVLDEADEPLQCDLSDESHRTDQNMTNFPGQMTCLLSALLSMDVINEEPSQGQGQEVKGPLTYRQVQDMYRPLAFHRVVFEELLSTPRYWQYIFAREREGRRRSRHWVVTWYHKRHVLGA